MQYYALAPQRHNKLDYAVGDTMELTDKQAHALALQNKVTTCSRAAMLVKHLRAALTAQHAKEAEDKALAESQELAKGVEHVADA